MFDWFWEFLYGICKSLYRVIDAMILGCRKLCGIDPVSISGEDTDFLTYLINNQNVKSALGISIVVAFILLIILTIIAVIRAVVSEKGEGNPAKLFVKAGKLVLTFLCVPMIMLFSMWLINAMMTALYNATIVNPNATVGSFLFVSFAQDTQMTPDIADMFLNGTYLYTDTDIVWVAVGDLSDYDFILSWICSIAILFPVASMLIMFVDRAITIVILYIAAPVSISTAVIDDGQHFKLWRDQVLVKYITGYGALIGLNIYIMIVNIIMSGDVVFFDDTMKQIVPLFSNNFLNTLLKIAIILGGAFSMQKIMGVVGNLVQSGAGSSEMRDAAMSAAQAGGFAMSGLRFAGKTAVAPLKAGRWMYNKAQDIKHKGFKQTAAEMLGLKTDKDYEKGGGGGSMAGGNNANNNKLGGNGKVNAVEQALRNMANNNVENNQNNQQPQQQNNSMLQNAMNNTIGKLGKGTGGE